MKQKRCPRCRKKRRFVEGGSDREIRERAKRWTKIDEQWVCNQCLTPDEARSCVSPRSVISKAEREELEAVADGFDMGVPDERAIAGLLAALKVAESALLDIRVVARKRHPRMCAEIADEALAKLGSLPAMQTEV